MENKAPVKKLFIASLIVLFIFSIIASGCSYDKNDINKSAKAENTKATNNSQTKETATTETNTTKAEKTSVNEASQPEEKAVTIKIAPQFFTPTDDKTPTEKTPIPRVALDKIAEDFHKLYPHITVEIMKGVPNASDEFATWFTTRIASGEAPDISFSSNTIASWVEKGWALPLDAYYSTPNPFIEGNQHWMDAFTNEEIILKSADGNHYQVPLAQPPGSPVTFYYNIDIFKALNLSVPKTWKEFVEVVKKANEAGYIGSAPGVENKGPTLWPLDNVTIPLTLPLLNDYNYTGASAYAQLKGDEDIRAVKIGIIDMKKPEFQEAWKQYKEWASLWPKGWNTQDLKAQWKAGKVAIREGGMWELQQELSDTKRTFKWGVFPMPFVGTDSTELAADLPRKTGFPKNVYSSFDLALIKPSLEKNGTEKAAVLFLQYLTSPKVNEYLVNEVPFARPAVNDAASLPIFDALKNVEHAEFPPVYVTMPAWLSPEVTETIGRNATMWFSSEISDDKFFTTVEKAMQKGADELIKGQGIDTSNW
ncbi:ABC transporter substrate-binding protein [Paenibacillus lignilyticus]|uniref:Extracellular solute-binding protein n=1 Tax=Paenibacillus lignilyticus TaxID=1172615 RepID=A0ABS5C9J7_9BACL|nr:extracellular solute-binding protein [Paenibacillus lignilyticus]MBP3962671.1 extracellular solute-binding protein [Paenibacillus lignilyticus]